MGHAPTAAAAAAEAAAAAAVAEDGVVAAEFCPPPEGSVKVGDFLVGYAKKNKLAYDNVKCTVLAILAGHYRVQLLTGTSMGYVHKFSKKMVSVWSDPEVRPPAIASSSASPAAFAEDVTDNPANNSDSDDDAKTEPAAVNIVDELWAEF